MFKYCDKIDKICPFSADSVFCGLGKGTSQIKDIQSCDGKKPKYSKKFLDKLYLENRRVELKEKKNQQGKSGGDLSTLPIFQK